MSSFQQKGYVRRSAIDVVQPIWPWGCRFWAYVGQSHSHIGWATSMSSESINPVNPRTNPWNFHEKYWELAILKISFFLSWPFWIFFLNKFFFASSQWKSVTNYELKWMGLNFYDYDGLQFGALRLAWANWKNVKHQDNQYWRFTSFLINLPKNPLLLLRPRTCSLCRAHFVFVHRISKKK